MTSRKSIISSDCKSESITTSFPFKAMKPKIDFDFFFPLYLTIGVFITLLLFGFS